MIMSTIDKLPQTAYQNCITWFGYSYKWEREIVSSKFTDLVTSPLTCPM